MGNAITTLGLDTINADEVDEATGKLDLNSRCEQNPRHFGCSASGTALELRYAPTYHLTERQRGL